MSDLGITRARAALLRSKLAAEDSGNTGNNLMALLEGTGGLGLIGGAANWAHSAYKRTPPSLLTLAEHMWQDPRHLERFTAHLDPSTSTSAARALALIKEDPRALRRLLMNERVVGIPDHIAETVRNLTFGSTTPNPWAAGYVKPTASQPGDVLLHTPVDEMANRWGRTANLLSGNSHNHAAIVGDRDTMYNFLVNERGRPVVESNPLQDIRHDNLSFMRFRDEGLTPEQVGELKTKIPQTYNRTVEVPDRHGGTKQAPIPFDYRKSSNLGLREVAPEFNNAAGGSYIGRFLDWVAGNKPASNLAKRLMPTEQYKEMIGYRRLADRCGPGEVCSTMAGRALESVGAPVSKNMSPGDVMRNAGPGKRFRTEEIHLPAYMRNRDYLGRANLRRWGPLALRAPAMLGMVGLGTYGVHDALNRYAKPMPQGLREKLQEKLPPAPVPSPSPSPAPAPSEVPVAQTARQSFRSGLLDAAKTSLGSWWQRIQSRYGRGGTTA